MYATVTFFFIVSVFPAGSFASVSLRAAPFNPTTSLEKLPGCKTGKSVCSTMTTSGNIVTEVKRHCLCPDYECTMYPDHASLQIAKQIWYGTCHPLRDIPDCRTGQIVVQAAAEDAKTLEVQCRCVKHSSGQTALWDDEESFLSRPFCAGSDVSSTIVGNRIDNANEGDNDSERISLETLINSTRVSGRTDLEDFYRRKSENYRNLSILGRKRELRIPALFKRNPFRVVLSKANAVNMHPVIVANQETESFVQCVEGSKSFYCKNFHEDPLIKQPPKLRDAFYTRAFNNTIRNKFQKPLGPNRKLSKSLPGQSQSQNLAVKSKFYEQEDGGSLGYSRKTHNTDCELCKRFDDINKNNLQNNAFFKRPREKRTALDNTKPIARSILYKQRSEASREHTNKRRADDIFSFYKRASDDHSNFYKRRHIEKRAFYNRMQHGNTAFYKRSSHDNSTLYKRSLDDISAFYKRLPDDSAFYKRSPDDSAFYKRSPDDDSAFYKRSPDDDSAFYKRSPDDDSAFYKRSPDDDSAFYKRSRDDNSMFYKRLFDENSAFYKRSPDDNRMFYKRSPDDNSMFYKRSPDDNSMFYNGSPHARSAFYKRALEDKAAFYKRAFDDKNAFYKRGRNEQSKFYKRGRNEQSKFYKRGRNEQSKFYKRGRNEQSKFYKRKQENNALYKREIIEEAALYKQQGENDNLIPRPSHYTGMIDKQQREDKSSFYDQNDAFQKHLDNDNDNSPFK